VVVEEVHPYLVVVVVEEVVEQIHQIELEVLGKQFPYLVVVGSLKAMMEEQAEEVVIVNCP
jgi:hypothetical protein